MRQVTEHFKATNKTSCVAERSTVSSGTSYASVRGRHTIHAWTSHISCVDVTLFIHGRHTFMRKRHTICAWTSHYSCMDVTLFMRGRHTVHAWTHTIHAAHGGHEIKCAREASSLGKCSVPSYRTASIIFAAQTIVNS
jgi:hypothetical protein